MSRWRIAVVLGLILLPVLVLTGLGSYYLWTLHWGFYAWWPMAACTTLGYLLGWYWQYRRKLLHPPDFDTPTHWTDQDRRAWQLVQARAEAVDRLPADQLTEAEHYLKTAEQMAHELAAFYHPGATDYVSNLTLPEVLAVVELAAHDLGVLVDSYLPGGHLLTLGDWQRARKALDWYQAGSELYWAISALFSPVETGTRYAASKLGLSQPLQMLQRSLLAWVHTAFIHRLGAYLIDLNSGRLRIGAGRYRELVRRMQQRGLDAPGSAPVGPTPSPSAAVEEEAPQVTVSLLGQVKAGKSSLINALLGEHLAVTDVLPATQGVQRYDLHPAGAEPHLVLADTVGYGHEGPQQDQLEATRRMAEQSDLLLMVLHALNPGRQADLALLQDLHAWFTAHPRVKRPAVLAVLTHVDLISPSLNWSPPYCWRTPGRGGGAKGPAHLRKEENIRQAVAVVHEQLGSYLTDVVAVCVAPGKVYGIEDELLPAMLARMEEARGVALLRCLRAEADRNKVRRVFEQMLVLGKEAARVALEQVLRLRSKAGKASGDGASSLSPSPQERS